MFYRFSMPRNWFGTPNNFIPKVQILGFPHKYRTSIWHCLLSLCKLINWFTPKKTNSKMPWELNQGRLWNPIVLFRHSMRIYLKTGEAVKALKPGPPNFQLWLLSEHGDRPLGTQKLHYICTLKESFFVKLHY